jgi:hypothetical protein
MIAMAYAILWLAILVIRVGTRVRTRVPRVSKLFAVDEPLEIFCVHGDEPKGADSPSASCELGVLRRT